MDITTILAIICSAVVFLAWFVLPSKATAPGATAVEPILAAEVAV